MLSDKEHKALMFAYSEDLTLVADTDPMFGSHPRTIRALAKKGFIEAYDEDDEESEYELTRAGRVALGLTAAAMKKPARVKTAVLRAIRIFIGETRELKACVFPPKQLNAQVWVNDEQAADYIDAMMLVDLREADLGFVDEHCWTCVGQLVGELGFPCDVETNRQIASFWPQD